MRNLRTVSFEEVVIPAGLPLSATAWDTVNDTAICTFGPTPTNATIELKRKTKWSSHFQLIASWDSPCLLAELACDEVLSLHYFADLAQAYIVLAGGDIIVIREDPLPGQEKVEIIGSIDVGISAAAWAPDEELLTFVTRSDSVVLVNRNFEPVAETELTAEDLKASKHVSVGWGKKETQFQGKRAKAMRDPTVPEAIDEGKQSTREDGLASISWRGDGAYFAVNNIVPGGRRVIRVFDRDAVLDSASEPVDCFESPLSWKPSGNLIASVKRSDSKVEVVFFERNGLRHGEFDLRLSQDDMNTWASKISLTWNIDSSVLAVAFLDRIQLWTVGNYHYYLKQEIIQLAGQLSPEGRLPALRWHSEIPSRLLIPASGSLIDAGYLASVCRGPLVPPLDRGAVAVVDGKILKLTPLQQAGVPPPMSFCEIICEHNILDCAFSDTGEQIAVLTTQSLELCTWPIEQPSGMSGADTTARKIKRYSSATTKETVELSLTARNGKASKYTQVTFAGHDTIYLLAPPQRGFPAQLKHLNIQDKITDSSFESVEVCSSAQSIATDVHQKSLWVLDRSHTSLAIGCNQDASEIAVTSFDGAVPDTVIYHCIPPSMGQANGYHGSTAYRIFLTTKGTLQADDRILARDCSSFLVTDAHIIFTTTQHLLKFIHLTDPAQMDIPGNTPEIDERCRSIERGAKIVTVIPSMHAVVLQMSRGNLETIFPRVLVLSGIRRHIANLEYRAAFVACQTHQVDLNILHDCQPDAFHANVSRFIDELKKPVRVDEFISKLKDEDVTQSLYRDTLKDSVSTRGQSDELKNPPANTQATGKVNRICDALLSVLSSRSSDFLQNLITAHVCKRPPDLNAALTLVSKLRQTSTDEADLAISHLCFLTDTNRLYDAALALYDLEVALLIAQNAQRDPREYMPFLQSLQSLPILRRQYTIDNHLKNYATALTSLHALSAHSEAEAYTIKHSLYPHALDLYKYTQSHLSNLTRHYASYLASQSQPLQAATLYDSLSEYTLAYPLYALAHAWRESLTCATLIPLPAPQLHSLATSLATSLADESRDYRAAATIHAEYLHDIPSAARVLCRGSYFADATRLLALHKHASLIPEIITPALLEKFSEILSLISDCRAQLSSQVPRILELRRLKASDPLAFFGGDRSDTLLPSDENIDNISLAPTTSTHANASLFTRASSSARFGGTIASGASHRTSKTRRKEERKRARGKKGSVYEEEYLVASVGRLFERVNGTHEEVRRLVWGLARGGMREQVLQVERVMSETVREMEGARCEVWGENEGGGGEGEGERRPRGGDGVFWESQMQVEEVAGMKQAPEVKVWKGGEMF